MKGLKDNWVWFSIIICLCATFCMTTWSIASDAIKDKASMMYVNQRDSIITEIVTIKCDSVLLVQKLTIEYLKSRKR